MRQQSSNQTCNLFIHLTSRTESVAVAATTKQEVVAQLAREQILLTPIFSLARYKIMVVLPKLMLY